jgi:hypothetical protein
MLKSRLRTQTVRHVTVLLFGSYVLQHASKQLYSLSRTLCVGTRSLPGNAAHWSSVQLMSRVILPGCPDLRWLYTMPVSMQWHRRIVNGMCTAHQQIGSIIGTNLKLATRSRCRTPL